MTEPGLVESRASVVLGQDALESRIVALDASRRIVYDLADGALAGLGLQVLPARFSRDPKDRERSLLVSIFGVRGAGFLRLEFGVLLLKGIGDVLELEEDEAEQRRTDAMNNLNRDTRARVR